MNTDFNDDSNYNQDYENKYPNFNLNSISNSKRILTTPFKRNINSSFGKNVTRINIELEECIFTYDLNSYSELRVLKKMIQTSLNIKRSIIRLFKNEKEINDSDNIRINEIFPNQEPIIDLKCILAPTEPEREKNLLCTTIKLKNLCNIHKKYSIIYCFTCNKSICNACLYENQEHFGHIYSDKMDYCRDSKILVEEIFQEITNLISSIEPINESKFENLSEISDKYFNSVIELVYKMKTKTMNFIKDFYLNSKTSRTNINRNLEYLKETCTDSLDLLKERLVAKKITNDDEVFLEFYQRYNEIKNEQEIIKNDKKNLENLKNYFCLISENIEMFLDKLNMIVYDQEKDFSSHLDAVENSSIKVNEITEENLNRIQNNVLRNVKDGFLKIGKSGVNENIEKIRKSLIEKSNIFSFNDYYGIENLNRNVNKNEINQNENANLHALNISNIPEIFKNNRDGLYKRSILKNKDTFDTETNYNNNLRNSQINSKRFININQISDFDDDNSDKKFVEIPGQTKILTFFPEIRSKEKNQIFNENQIKSHGINNSMNINDILNKSKSNQNLNFAEFAENNEIERKSYLNFRKNTIKDKEAFNYTEEKNQIKNTPLRQEIESETQIKNNNEYNQYIQDKDAKIKSNNSSKSNLKKNSKEQNLINSDKHIDLDMNLDLQNSQLKNNKIIYTQEINSNEGNILFIENSQNKKENKKYNENYQHDIDNDNDNDNDYEESEIIINDDYLIKVQEKEAEKEKFYSQILEKSKIYSEEDELNINEDYFSKKLNTQYNNLKSENKTASKDIDYINSNMSNSKFLSGLLEDPLTESMVKKYGDIFTNSKNYNIIFAPIKYTRNVCIYYELINDSKNILPKLKFEFINNLI
jgi:hypothetical protein